MRRLLILGVVAWWWLYTPGLWPQRQGPFLEPSYCENFAARYRSAGYQAFCVREG